MAAQCGRLPQQPQAGWQPVLVTTMGVDVVRPFGDLEAAIMQVLWAGDEPATVREVMGRLQTPKPLAYTTVMTVLDNLHRKEEVARDMDGRAWRYRPVRTRAEHAAALLQEVLQHAGDSQAVLMHFVADLGPDEVTQLQQAVRAAQDAQANR